ncbi:unnamed protein product [Rotaria sp. Silwood2]|nr:unnamed protein product [Rotaria sp. Silwood2]CAF2930761.1 unnamed protein product [Rotaria sp. Silwood2]
METSANVGFHLLMRVAIPSSNEFTIKQIVAGDRQVVLAWNKVSEAIGYVLEYGSGSNIYVDMLGSEITSSTVTNLNNGSTYYFKVFARLKTGLLAVTPTVSITVGRWSGLQPYQLGLLVNDNEPDSIAVAEYYRIRRQIPSENIVHLNFSKVTRLTNNEFMPLKNKVDEKIPTTVQALAIAWTIPYVVTANTISETTDVLFYFQGLHAVNDIATNKYPPGAVADHLTSYGGMLTDSSQMSALEFIAGGATRSFGTVSEPCSWTQKFPNPQFTIQHYTKGETLIESYWKSILQVFQGVFVGEPLANPWRKQLS